MKSFFYQCERSTRPEHQSNWIVPAYFTAGTFQARSIQQAYEGLEKDLRHFMRAIPGVFTLTIRTARSRKVWEFDTRPPKPVENKKRNSTR